MVKRLDSMPDDEIVRHVRGCFRDFESFFSDKRDEMADDYDFVAGRQWPPEDAEVLNEQNRPFVTFNLTLKFILAVVGMEINNKMESKYIPGGIDDNAAADLLTAVIRNKTSGHSEQLTTAAFKDTLICGYGWTDTRIDYTGRLEGEIKHTRVDPGQVGWEPRAEEPNLTDARWVFRVRDYSEDEMEERWPGSTNRVAAGNMVWSKTSDLGTGTLLDRGEYAFEGRNADTPLKLPSRYRVIHFQQASMRDDVVITDPETGMPLQVMSEDEFEERNAALAERGVPTLPKPATVQTRIWHSVDVCRNVVLGEVTTLPCRTLECMTGMYDRNKGYFFGLTRLARDPQRWANKFMSTIMHVMASAGKGVWMEMDAVPANKLRDFMNDFARPDRPTMLSPGALMSGKIKPIEPVPLPPGLSDLVAMAADAVPGTMGIAQETLGLTGRTQSGEVEGLRKAANLNVVAEYFAARRTHIIRTGMICMGLVLDFMPDWVFTQAGGPSAAEILPRLRSAPFVQHIVHVDEQPSTPDRKAKIWSDFLQMAPALIPLGLPNEFWIAMLQYSSLPVSAIEALAKALSQPPDPIEEQAKQLALAKSQADVVETQSKAALNMAKAQEAGTPDLSNVLAARAQAEKAAMDSQFRQQEHGMKLDQLSAKTQAEVIKAMMQARREQEKAVSGRVNNGGAGNA